MDPKEMNTQKRNYDYYFDNGDDDEIPKNAVIFSYLDDDLYNDSGTIKLPFEKMKVEYDIFGNWEWVMDTFAYDWTLEGNIEKLSLQDACRKGVRITFTMQ